MTRRYLLPLVAVVAAVALFVCATNSQAAEQQHHKYQIKVIPHGQHAGVIGAPTTPALNGVAAWFGASPYTDPALVNGPINSDNTEVWPCFGSFDGSNTSTANADCAYMEDTGYGSGTAAHVFLIGGTAVLGTPEYTWSLTACDGDSSTSAPCGQTNSWYEDNTGDSTDDLTYLIVATQVQGGVTVTLADSGTVDFGPNVYGGLSPAADVVIYGDQTFGTLGATGKNNGNCEADYNYPLASAANPGAVYVIEANKTCVDPAAGPVTITATTEVATPAYTKSTSPTVCAPAGVNPCYTVKYTKKYSVLQKWTINLQ